VAPAQRGAAAARGPGRPGAARVVAHGGGRRGTVVRGPGVLAERAGAGAGLLLGGVHALVAAGLRAGPRGPADRVVAVALIPGEERNRPVVGVAAPGVALVEGQRRRDHPGAARVVRRDGPVIAERPGSAAIRPDGLVALRDVGGGEVDGVPRDRDVLGL